MKNEALAVMLALLVAGSLSIGFFGGISNRQVTTTTLTIPTTQTSIMTRTTTTTLISSTTQTRTITRTTTIESNAILSLTLGSPIPIGSVETGNISVGGYPRTIAVNPKTDRVFVADYFSNNITVIDTSTNSIVTTIELPASDNNGIAVDSNTDMVYALISGCVNEVNVTNSCVSGSGSALKGGIVQIDGATNKIVGELPLDFGPGSMAYDPSNHLIYGSPESLGNSSLIAADVRTGDVAFNVSLGYWANSVVVDSLTDIVFATGCAGPFVCNSLVSAVNATSGVLLNQITLGNDAYPRLTINPLTNVAYVSGSAQLVALNGTTGKLIFNVNSMACGPLDSLTTDTSSNQVLAMSSDYNYILAYDGTTGALVNMYSSPSSPNYVAYDSGTNEVYVTTASGHTGTQGWLLAFPNVFSTGHANADLIGAGQNCPLP